MDNLTPSQTFFGLRCHRAPLSNLYPDLPSVDSWLVPDGLWLNPARTLFPVKLKWEHNGEWTAHSSFKKPIESDFYHLTVQHEQCVDGKQLISRFPSTPMEVDRWLTHKALHIYMHRELRWFVCLRVTLTDNVCVNGPCATGGVDQFTKMPRHTNGSISWQLVHWEMSKCDRSVMS